MTKNKDFKRLVRQRMSKTGESYTAARAQLVKKQALPADYEKRAGKSDAVMQSKTGKTWPEWLRVLDAVNATSMTHGDIARYLVAQHEGVSGWWAQTITVGYERLRGLRDVGQRRGGAYEASKSKTFAVPAMKLWRAFASKAARARWLGVDAAERSQRPHTTLRFDWPDGTAVDVFFAAKAPQKTQLTIQHKKLPNRRAVDDAKAFWGERLQALAERMR